MIEENAEKVNRYFDQKISQCGLRRRELQAEGRLDEAVFENVKENVYHIFHSVLSAAVKNCNQDPKAVKNFFLQKIEEIPSNWESSCQKAEQNNDTEKMQIEKLKLGTAREIKGSFVKLWED